MGIVILNESEIRSCVSLDHEAILAVEDAFTRLANGAALVPPIIGIEVPDVRGEVDIKTAYIRGLDSFAVKIASGFFENEKLGLPVSSGMMVIISAKTGFPEAVLFDNGYLTQVRTGAAGAIAAKYLARSEINVVGIIGAGTQGRYQAKGVKQVREFTRLLIYDIESGKVDAYAAEMAETLKVDVVKARSVEQVVRESDLVVTTTPSRQPYLKADWLHPGLHITAMGADAEGKQELSAEVIGRVDLIACDLASQCFVRGELHHALDEGIISAQTKVVEMGELTSGRHRGRKHEGEITLCDLTGVGVQDTAIATLAFRKTRFEGVGVEIQVEG